MKPYAILFYLLLAIGANSFTSIEAQTDINDSLALVDFYNSTNGPHWSFSTNWLTTAPVSTWYGITVTGSNVTEINLFFNDLSGTLPSSIGNLVQLQRLLISSNYISGAIPVSIGNLVNLEGLFLSSNQLTGAIPSSIVNLVHLISLQLNNNQLTGTIPSSIGNLVNLLVLDLASNQLSGIIPSSIGNLVNLQVLYLSLNQLSGSIPSSIGNLVNLHDLALHTNKLSGPIPASFGNMANLVNLSLSNNQLSDSMPPSFGNLVQLNNVDVSYNHLSGEIPHSFKKLHNVVVFNVSHNQLWQGKNVPAPLTDEYIVFGYLNDNHFTFDGAEYIAQKFPYTSYAPQANIPVHQNGNTLSVYAGGTLSNNTYTWFSMGPAGSKTITGDSTFMPTQSGKYYVTVTNKIATQLTLYSDTVDFTINKSLITSNKMAIIPNKKQSLQVSPNPAGSTITIHVNGTADIIITNSAGKVMLTKKIALNAIINVSTFANGIYYIQNKTTGEIQKIVVIH
jgi:hypothetical protein